MKSRKKLLSNKKQLAFELDERDSSPSRAGDVVPETDGASGNIIFLDAELRRQERDDRGVVYATIMSLAKHLD
jgi:hypothetical protein